MQQLQIPPLAEGEIYLCGLVDANGDVEHTVLLPGDSERAAWQTQIEWAKSIGGELPTRPELAIAFAKHRELFQKAAHWSNEEDADDPGWAWYLYFGNGLQYYDHTDTKRRARAVRRFKN
ncbi:MULTISPECIES: Lcl C-terminal domain-containing protein [Paraburkholderia]|uniref:DUF1566 domain-containing protein n=1 Tax=Paraburkholderia TaxID=1822464 RepID=UPI0022536D68|nr:MULTISPECIES: DUF1566 domain-containing protein [Paraburkholderia]MCX4154961.1 DUF1566 domain-containing protein [Paraburkholderia aspalathi]MDN7164373.1 DUF1566 domain-containing protein [Paraburkholderia sp. SECH2]MDQ6392858.1 DUF1566 domain-containing protein [Paraburkholderia aspalathi]